MLQGAKQVLRRGSMDSLCGRLAELPHVFAKQKKEKHGKTKVFIVPFGPRNYRKFFSFWEGEVA